MYTLANNLLAAQTWIIAQNTAPAPSGTLSGGLIYTLIIGLVIGVIAKLITPGKDPGGCIITSLIGIGGALIAYFIGASFGHYGNGQTPGIIASVIGAVVLLVIYHATIGRRGGPTA